MRLAIVHDYLNQRGGAERVVEVMHAIFPDAPIFTSFYTPNTMPDSFTAMDIRTTWMQDLPGKERHFKKYLLLYPKAMASIDLAGYDLILSSSSAWAKGIKVPAGALHICYCYTPMRWVYNYTDYVEREGLGAVIRTMLPLAIKRLKKWDLSTNDSIDEIIAISEFVRDRIKKVWGRESTVIYPPVDCSRFSISRNIDEYFLIVSRLNTYKKIELAVAACTELGLPLKIIGSGPAEPSLKQIAGPTIEFLGRLDDRQTATYFSNCRALIFPGEEDFGITPVEAQAAGRPVIAFRGGGALETVVEGQTGVFFDRFETDSLKKALIEFEDLEFNPNAIREQALKFDTLAFKRSLVDFINRHYQDPDLTS